MQRLANWWWSGRWMLTYLSLVTLPYKVKEVAYQWFASNLPAMPARPTETFDERTLRAFAVGWGWGLDEREERPGIVDDLVADTLGQPLPKPRGVSPEELLARLIVRSDPTRRNNLQWQVATATATEWLERHWTRREVLTAWLERAYFGREPRGLREAARAYFAAEPADLSLPRLASLVARSKGGRRLPLAERTRDLLEKLGSAEPFDPAEIGPGAMR